MAYDELLHTPPLFIYNAPQSVKNKPLCPRVRLFSVYLDNRHIAVCADAEWGSPQRETTRHVGVGRRPLAVAVALVVHHICRPAQRPHLTVVRMPREVYIDAEAVAKAYIVGLVVEDDGQFIICPFK